MVVGTISHRQAPILKKVYDQMAEPKWVIAFGACTCSGGPYNNYSTVQGIDTIIPVEIGHIRAVPAPGGSPGWPHQTPGACAGGEGPVLLGRHRELRELELPVVEKPIA